MDGRTRVTLLVRSLPYQKALCGLNEEASYATLDEHQIEQELEPQRKVAEERLKQSCSAGGRMDQHRIRDD
jgi:hypothetical protein